MSVTLVLKNSLAGDKVLVLLMLLPSTDYRGHHLTFLLLQKNLKAYVVITQMEKAVVQVS